MSGKGMRPQNGYNRAKWEANYDAVFGKKPKNPKKPLKTKQTGWIATSKPKLVIGTTDGTFRMKSIPL